MKVRKLIKYIKTEESKLLKLLHKELLKKDYTVLTNEKEEYLYGFPREETDIPVVLVAHVDTVHRKPPELVFYDSNNRVMWSPEGLGADDRAGVFAITEIIKEYRVPVIFTTGEEWGGKGAKALIKDIPDNPNDYKVVIQLDRRGANDCVFYSNDADEFHSYIEEFGFKKTTGSFSDISVIGPAWKVNSVNLSIGYVDEHRNTEHLFVNRMESTVDKVLELLKNPIPDIEYKEKEYKATVHDTGSYWDSTKKKWVPHKEAGGSYSKSLNNYKTLCEVCGKFVYYADRHWDEEDLYCKECFEDWIEGRQLDLFSCVLCNTYVEEFDEHWIDEIELICDDCFKLHQGYACEQCRIETLPSASEYSQAVELQICDECYEDVFFPEDSKDRNKKDKKVDRLVAVK